MALFGPVTPMLILVLFRTRPCSPGSIRMNQSQPAQSDPQDHLAFPAQIALHPPQPQQSNCLVHVNLLDSTKVFFLENLVMTHLPTFLATLRTSTLRGPILNIPIKKNLSTVYNMSIMNPNSINNSTTTSITPTAKVPSLTNTATLFLDQDQGLFYLLLFKPIQSRLSLLTVVASSNLLTLFPTEFCRLFKKST